MWLNYLPTKWLKSFLGWFRSERDEEETKESIPEEPVPTEPAPPIRKGSLEDIAQFCDEIRKDLRIRKRLDELHKKNDDRLYVEVGNLRDKIERFLQRQK